MRSEILSGLNNFSTSFKELIDGANENKSDIPRELAFLNLQPLLIPPPPDDYILDTDEEDIPPRKEDTITDVMGVGRKIMILQNSILDLLKSSDDTINDQKQTLKILKSQSLVSTITQFQQDTEIRSNPSILSNQNNPTNDNYGNRLLNLELNLPKIPAIEVDLKYPSIDSLKVINYQIPNTFTEISKIENYKTPNTFTEISKIENYKTPNTSTEILKIKNPIFDYVSIPTNLENLEFKKPQSLEFQDSKIIEIPIKYGNLSNIPIPNVDLVTIPVEYEYLSKLKTPIINQIELPISFTEVPYKYKSDLKPIIQPIEFEKIQNFTLPTISTIEVPINYSDFSKPNIPNINPIVISTEYETKSIGPKFDKIEIPVNYFYSNQLENLDMEDLQIPIKYGDFPKLVDLPVFNSIELPMEISKSIYLNKISDVDNLKNEKNDFTNLNTTISLLGNSLSKLSQNRFNPIEKNYENLNIGDLIPTKDLIKNDEVNDGFVNTIGKISLFFDEFINGVDKLNDFNLVTKFSNMTNNVNRVNELINQLDTNFDFGKINTISKVSTPNVMMSMMETKQFNLLMEGLEKNSKIISETFTKDRYKNSDKTETPLVNFKPQTTNQINSNKDPELIKVMSSLDEKMSIMISALSNISSWVSENRSTSTSLRPYKH